MKCLLYLKLMMSLFRQACILAEYKTYEALQQIMPATLIRMCFPIAPGYPIFAN
jgi:hypothetical protein